MISIARRFGAPVIEPPGKHDTSTSGCRTSGRTAATTDDTRCITLAVRSSSHSAATCTEPGTEVGTRSLRSRSTIITFSARSLTERRERGGQRARPRPASRRGGACP